MKNSINALSNSQYAALLILSKLEFPVTRKEFSRIFMKEYPGTNIKCPECLIYELMKKVRSYLHEGASSTLDGSVYEYKYIGPPLPENRTTYIRKIRNPESAGKYDALPSGWVPACEFFNGLYGNNLKLRDYHLLKQEYEKKGFVFKRAYVTGYGKKNFIIHAPQQYEMEFKKTNFKIPKNLPPIMPRHPDEMKKKASKPTLEQYKKLKPSSPFTANPPKRFKMPDPPDCYGTGFGTMLDCEWQCPHRGPCEKFNIMGLLRSILAVSVKQIDQPQLNNNQDKSLTVPQGSRIIKELIAMNDKLERLLRLWMQ